MDMAYYVDTIEQVKGESGVNEYGKREKKGTFAEARTAFFQKLTNVSNDLVDDDPEKKHYFMDIRIVNSLGGIEKEDTLGTYKES